MIRGCDVSKWQGLVDWRAKALEGFQFAIIKASEAFSIDPYFRLNYAAAKAQGLKVGAYHFFRPELDAAEQAKFFINVVGDAKVRKFLDHEVSGGLRRADQISQAQVFLDAVEASGTVPGYYSDRGFFVQLQLPKSFARYPLWLAEFNSTYSSPSPWTSSVIWQCSNSDNTFDIDQFIGTQEEMQAFFGT